mgnify:CR=1 FL=1
MVPWPSPRCLAPTVGLSGRILKNAVFRVLDILDAGIDRAYCLGSEVEKCLIS